ncbi:MAG TPA: hypothetical protein PK156_26460 [Polyangium sp.]|nr:hypothetical protein [Polyangium sp.]
MSKHKKNNRSLPSPADVLAGRVHVDARTLIALIREVNPTGLELERKETARRYALKSRLQSMLVRVCPEDIEAFAKVDESGVVLLRHRSLDINACHALLAELDDDARAKIQYLLDTGGYAEEAAAPDVKGAPSRATYVAPNSDSLDAVALLSAGHVALQAYDYDLARQQYEAAFETTGGGKEAVHALLSLFVEQLGADHDALELEPKLVGVVRADPTVRGLLAIAAARSGQRAQAIGFVEERGSKPSSTHVAEVFVILAKTALVDGDLTQASKDLERASEQIPTHPELVTLTDALVKARGLARIPMENEVLALFAAGRFREAEELAQQVLVRFGDSEVARRILRGIDEQKKLALARRRLDEARTALDAGDENRGMSLLRAALGMGLGLDDAAWAEARIAEMEKQARQRIEDARIADTLRILGTQSLVDGLNAYASLGESTRRKVAERISLRAISWFEELCLLREGGKASAIVDAIVALDRAMEVMSVDPGRALELIGAHERMLAGFKRADDVGKAAGNALAEQQRRTAQDRLEMVRQTFESGELHRAQRMVVDIVVKHLCEQDAQVLNELRMSIQHALERNALEVALEEHRRQDNPMRALAVARRLAAVVEGEQVARLAEVCKELRERTRRAFSMHIERAGEEERVSPKWNLLRNARILPKWKWTTLMVDPVGGPNDLLLILTEAKAGLVFIRVLEVATNVVRTRITFRTPSTFELLRIFLRSDRLILIDRFGAFIELDVHDWAVLQWCPNILRPTETAAHVNMDRAMLGLALPDVMIEDCTISQDGQYLWVNIMHGRQQFERSRRVIHVLEFETFRLVRELREHPHGRLSCQVVSGFERPCIAVVDDVDNDYLQYQTYFYDPNGRLLWQTHKAMAIPPLTLVARPDGTHVFGATSDPDGPEDPSEVKWGFCQTNMQGTSALDYSLDTTAVYNVTAVTNRHADMCFLLVNARKGNELFGLRPTADGFEIAHRTFVPRNSALVSTPDGSHAALLVVYLDRHEFVRLDANAPRIESSGNCAPFMLPSTPRSSLNTKHFNCHRPSGARARVVAGIEADLRKWGKTRYRDRVRVAMKRGDPIELLDLESALLKLGEPSMAGQLNAFISQRFGHHPRVRLVSSHHFGVIGQWAQMMKRIESIDPAMLDDTDAKHLHHMRGICWMMMDEPEKAIAEFTSCMKYAEGPCDPEELMALCKPLEGDTTPWQPEWTVLRDWLRQLVTADEAFARSDVRAARQAIDTPIIWDANEVQSFARLAKAFLDESEVGAESIDPFHQALAMATYCDLARARNTMTRREVRLPRATWDDEKLNDIAQRARQWLDSYCNRAPYATSPTSAKEVAADS